MLKAAIYSRIFDEEHREDIQFLFNELSEKNITAQIFENYFNQIKDKITFPGNIEVFSDHDQMTEETDFVVSLGGDGTLLDTIILVRNKEIPVMGINFGRLGFLAGFGPNEIKSAVTALSKRSFLFDKRSLIHLDADLPLFGDVPYALNDFVIHKRDQDSMIKIHTYLNGEFLNTYWADGVILSTPTGSTGYSLSCGGPIVFPESGSFVITPISPHNLNMRPIIVPDNNIISFEVESRTNEFICTLDSRKEIVGKNASLAVRKEEFKVNLIRLSENSFLQTIQNKLVWGLDKRN